MSGGPCGSVLVPLVTPVDEAGAVVEADVRRLIESVRPHAAALMPALSTGEGWALSEAQWEDMVGCTCRHAAGIPVYAGAEAPTTATVVDRARRARELGATAVVATTPFAPRLAPGETVAHYRAVHERGGLPVVLYDESALSGNVTDLDTLVACCRLDGVVAVKESSGDPVRAGALLAAGVPVDVYQGWEHLIADTPGLAGCAVALANLEPGLCREAARRPALRRRVADACARYRLSEPDWYVHVKAELAHRGLISSAYTIAPTLTTAGGLAVTKEAP